MTCLVTTAGIIITKVLGTSIRQREINRGESVAGIVTESARRCPGHMEVVTDYFLNQDDFGKIHFEGDHRVHVIRVFKNRLQLDRRFNLDFDTAFATGPARPHGIEMK